MVKKITIPIELDARSAQREARALAKEIDGVDGALGDAESAGKMMAKALQSQADAMIAEIDDTRRAVDALDRALGDVADVDTTAVVADLKRVGLTADDIEKDADELAAALRRAGDVKLHATQAGFRDLDDALGRTTDRSRVASTAIGGVGNSISELPGIGSLGPVAESMGMLAENALEGEANLKGLVVAGGGLAALGFTMGVISSAMDSMAKSRAFHKKRVEDFTEAIKELGEGVAAVNKVFEDTGKITGEAGGLGPFFEKTKDITDQLIDAGVSYDEFVKGVADGGAALEVVTGKLEAQRAKMVEARNEAQRNNEVTIEYERAISDLDNAIEIAKENHRDYGESVTDVQRRTEWMAGSARDAKGATAELIAAWKENAAGMEQAADDAATEIDNLKASYEELRDEITDDQSVINLAQQFDDTEAAAMRAWQAAVEFGEHSPEYQAAARAMATAQNDLKLEIIDYSENVEQIPPEKLTKFLADVDAGKVAEVERQFANLARNRQIRLSPVYTGSYPGGYSPGGGIDGDPATPWHTGGIVGEQRFTGLADNEVPAILEKGEAVLTRGQQGAVAQALAGGGPVFNITVHAGVGTDGHRVAQYIIETVNAYLRNGGTGFIR